MFFAIPGINTDEQSRNPKVGYDDAKGESSIEHHRLLTRAEGKCCHTDVQRRQEASCLSGPVFLLISSERVFLDDPSFCYHKILNKELKWLECSTLRQS